MRSMIPFIRRRPMGRAIYGQLYTGGGVTLVFTDPGVINPVHAPLHAHPFPPPRPEFESRIPKIVSDRNVELPFVKRYPILHQIARCPIIPPNSTCPSFPHPSPPEFGQGLTLDGGGGEGGCRCNGRDQVRVYYELRSVLEMLVLVLLPRKFVKILFFFFYLTRWN